MALEGVLGRGGGRAQREMDLLPLMCRGRNRNGSPGVDRWPRWTASGVGWRGLLGFGSGLTALAVPQEAFDDSLLLVGACGLGERLLLARGVNPLGPRIRAYPGVSVSSSSRPFPIRALVYKTLGRTPLKGLVSPLSSPSPPINSPASLVPAVNSTYSTLSP